MSHPLGPHGLISVFGGPNAVIESLRTFAAQTVKHRQRRTVATDVCANQLAKRSNVPVHEPVQ